MRLRRPCEHDRYDEHSIYQSVYKPSGEFIDRLAIATCPGGEFLPEDAIVIEKENGEWPEEAHLVARRWKASNDGTHHLFDALADQVGEPG